MSTKTKTKTVAPAVNPLYAKMREAIVAGIEGVTFVESKTGKYATIKLDKTTLGYINGTETAKRWRIDLPKRGSVRPTFVVERAADVAKLVTKLKTFVPAPKPAKVEAAKVEKSEAAKPATRKRAAAKPKSDGPEALKELLKLS